MIVYACLPSYEAYADRYHTFVSMCGYGAVVKMLLLHGDHPNLAHLPREFHRMTVPQEKSNIWTRRNYMRQLVAEAMTGVSETVLHDTFAPQMSMYAWRYSGTHRKRTNVRRVLSLYSATPTYFFKRHWCGRNKDSRITLREVPYYLRRYSREILNEFIAGRLADVVVGNSDAVGEDLLNFYRLPREKVRVIPAEVRNDFYCPGPERRASLGLDTSEAVILYVGKFQRIKGIDVLLRAFDALVKDGCRARLVLLGHIGEPGYHWYNAVLAQLAHSECVEIRAPVSSAELRDYYRSADVLVLPTYHEGSPRVVREAMACGCPVVTSSIQGNRIIDPQGSCFAYAEGWDPNEYTRLVRRFLDDATYRRERTSMGVSIAQSLSPESIAARYMDLYHSLFAAHHHTDEAMETVEHRHGGRHGFSD